MRIGFSTLIINEISDSQLSELYSLSDCIDWAPTVTNPHWDLIKNGVATVDCKKPVSAIQSIFYGIDNAHFMRSDSEFDIFINHLRFLINVSDLYQAKYILWGSPATRRKPDRTFSNSLMLKRLRRVLMLFTDCNVKLMIEAISPNYGCEFVDNSIDLINLNNEISSNNLAFHLDVGQMIDEGLDVIEFISANIAGLKHIHLSEPNYMYTGEFTELFLKVVDLLKGKDIDVVYEVQTIRHGMVKSFLNDFYKIKSHA
jgi:hypothetical protein